MIRALGLVIGLSVLLTTAGAATDPRTSEAATETYAQYSLMFEKAAGQYFAGGTAAGQWAWTPLSATESDISWGDPKAWPPASAEHFVHDGDWVLLEGYNDGAGRPLTQIQRVTTESLGDTNCTNLQPLPSDGSRQHYVKWTIPTSGYCLDATGTIKPPNGSATVNFRHLQKWLPPHPCSNLYYAGRTCITQYEQWWDDNQHAFSLQLTRTVELAKGLGMAFTNRTTVPLEWNADGHNYWHY